MKPTIQDIANIAGVSKATVSLALTDHPRISSETKIKIRNIAKEIGYAKGMAVVSEKTKTDVSLGVLYLGGNHDMEKGFFRDTLMGICEEAARSEFDVTMIGIHMDGKNNVEENITNRVIKSGVDGIIIITNNHQLTGFDKLLEMRFPMVFVGSRKVAGYSNPLHCVSSDNYNGGRMATEYLLGLGHKQIAMVIPQGAPHWEMERVDGYCAALRNAGLTSSDYRVIRVNSLYQAEDECWRELDRMDCTAIFAVNARVGITLLHYLRNTGKKIPDQVSLIVFDDFPSFSLEDPPVSVIMQDKKTLGTMSTKLLADILGNTNEYPRQIMIPTQLIERKSCMAQDRVE
ncbi:LacI family DNA-binding transcriptional regulator [Paenibacillus allorhizosphaerae]|uniref:HTH-type transcriptional regulator DegA n=1 Tax=Paenibacillus allorhizosphaerae TaxID=2849866 RepID=A0ABN7TKT9_9BACL|nr:LacI family DNA-binding transcriptional regulator [Paenibacillus allorhizosphaerae]CAG7644492.1 HTH-type transcriptional regulator DegA [Paenibacillus allorhizosphaerae]